MGTEFTFGQWLKRRRKALDFTQVELAARVPCAKSTVRRLEADDLRPSKLLAERLAALLHIPASQWESFVFFARNGTQPDSPFELLPTNAHGGSSAAITAALAVQTAQRYSIPAAANPLLGRLHAIAAAVELMLRPDVRLVTLIGPPGVGKTQLALQIARHIQLHFREGACFVSLAPLQDATHVLPAIAQAIDLLDSGQVVAAALADRLRQEELLLMLDNFEHVLSAAADIAALLSTAPALKLLCTSRIPLHISGEHEFVVPPLALPNPTQLHSLAALEANPAVALFTTRARAAQPNFAITPDNAPQIVEICHRLDGLPLAIELAAIRSKIFSPAALLARLEQRLPFLTGGTRDAPARQHTLEAAIGWSYDLLNELEKRSLARLGVFRGSWSLEAAEIICGDQEVNIIDTLTSLVDQSLVQPTHPDKGEVRFTMLETIREFALIRLQEYGETASQQAHHAHYFLSLAIEGEKGLQGSNQTTWMERLSADNNNLRTAFAWALSGTGDVELGLQAGAALWWFWWTSGQVGEGRQILYGLIQRAKDLGLGRTIAYGRAMLGVAILAFFAGDFETALPQLEEAQALGTQLNDLIVQGYATFMIGSILVLSNQSDKGYLILDQGYRALQEAGPAAVWHVGVTSLARTLLTFEESHLEEAQRFADTGMAIFQQLGQPYGIGLAFNYQGDVARLRHDLVIAAACYQAALPLLRQANAKSEIPAVLHNLGHVLLSQGHYKQAQTLFTEGLELHRAVGNRMGMVECFIGLAAVAVTQGQPQQAATLLGVADTLLTSLNVALFAAEQQIYKRTAETVSLMLGIKEWEKARQAGQTMPLTAALSLVSNILLDK